LTLSKNKQEFINKVAGEISYPLYADKLRDTAKNYQKKHNIKIIINGDTVAGQTMLAETSTLIKRLANLSDSEQEWFKSLNALIYVAIYWLPTSGIRTTVFDMPDIISDLIRYNGIDTIEECKLSDEQHEAIKDIVSQFLLDGENTRQPFTVDKISCLATELRNYFITSESGLPMLMRFTQSLSQSKASLKKINLDDISLNKNQIRREIDAIRAEITPGEFIGYIFTNQSKSAKGHKEALIITKTAVIKPVHWHSMAEDRSIKSGNIPDLYVSDWLSGMPQATGVECGTLSMLYLKELLKDNARQLKDYSLYFRIYSNSFDMVKPPALNFYYFPSPQVLRYSQSSYHNKYIEAMLQDTDVTILEHRLETSKVETLKKLLQNSMETALERGDSDTYDENERLLNQLPAFRKLWLEEYQVSSSKHELMNDQKLINRYLSYHSMKMASFFKEKLIASTPSDKPNSLDNVSSYKG
jgi:hypothetical protein